MSDVSIIDNVCGLNQLILCLEHCVSKMPYEMLGDVSKRASDANYDPVQMDMSEVQ